MIRAAKNLLTLAVALVCTLAGLELAARLLSGVLHLAPYMKYHATLGWTAKPHAVRHHVNPDVGFDVTYQINAMGYRGPLYEHRKADGVFRVIILGDSNAFGWGIPEGQQFAAILDRELPNTEIVNLSLSGYGTDQEYLRFMEDGRRFQPDLVVLQVSPNDFAEIQHSFFNSKPKPQFTLTPQGDLQLANVPVKAVGPRAQAHYESSLPLPFKQWLEWNSYAYAYLNPKYRSLYMRLAADEPSVSSARPDAIRAHGLQLFRALLDGLAREVRAAGAHGFAFYAWPQLSGAGYFDEAAIPVFDLHPALERDFPPDGDGAFFEDRRHWTPEANKTIARELGRIIVRQIYLERSDSPANGTGDGSDDS